MPIARVSFHKVLQKSVDNNQSLHMHKLFPSLNSVEFQNQWFQAYCISTMRWESSFTTKASSHYTLRSLSIHSGLLSSYASFLCLNVTSYPDGTPNQWYFLEEYGILVEPLRCKLWGDCSLTGGAQAIVDLLDHFDFAKTITSVLIEVEHHPGQKYFIPCMLKNISQTTCK